MMGPPADPGFRVVLDAHGLADVVQEEREVDQGRVLHLVEGGPVLELDRLGLGEDQVELRIALSV
jgi:hypothetical protein